MRKTFDGLNVRGVSRSIIVHWKIILLNAGVNDHVSRPARTRRGKRFIAASPEIHDRVIGAIQGLGTNPRPFGCRKLAGSKNDWRIRVGDYRVVYEIADEIRVVRINRVRHRREVYR